MSGPVLFQDLTGVSEETLAVLSLKGFKQATPVQEAVIPLFCGNKDVAVDAATGSGKTLAFVIPIVERLRKLQCRPRPHEVVAMVISPTRELSKQIFEVAEPFVASVPGCCVCLLVGGTDVLEEAAAVQAKGANVIIGTPGRIHDVMNRLSLHFKAFEVLVLDEADRLLEMGFQKQLDAIMGVLPKQRRTGLFSATQTDAVEALVRAGLRNPFRVNVAVTSTSAGAAAQKTPTTLSIEYAFATPDAKLNILVAFLRRHCAAKIIVYFLTCASVEFFSTCLPRLPGTADLSFMALHGHMKPRKRVEMLERFAAAEAGVLLCTDLAARGLDIPDVNWIFQFDPPQDPAAFVHRVGRTARMGRSGHALALLLPAEDAYVELLANRNIPLSPATALSDDSTEDLIPHVKRLAETDRDIMEKGTKAFVSFIRGYKEHHCKYIFRLAELDINLLAQLFGLLRLPAMQEVRKNRKGLKQFKISDVDPASVPYLDAAREQQRKKRLKVAQAAGLDPASLKAERQKQRALLAEAAAKKEAPKKVPAAKRQLLQQREERETLTEDYALLRKLKRGKMSEQEFDISMGLALNAPLETASPAVDLSDGADELGGDADGKAPGEGTARRVVRAVKCAQTQAVGTAPAEGVAKHAAVPAGKGVSRTVRKRRGRRAKAAPSGEPGQVGAQQSVT